MSDIKIMAVPMDNFACGHYRVLNVANCLYKDYKVTIAQPGTFNYIGQDYFFTQRAIGTNNMKTLLSIKEKSGVKFIIDFDDILWGEIPPYNFTVNKLHVNDNKESMSKYLDKLADHITVTTDALKESLTKFVSPSKISVIPNMLPRYKWNYNRNTKPTNDHILYAGSPTHFSNDKQMYGDFTNEWDKFLTTRTVNIMGRTPWFITPNKFYEWTDMLNYSHNFYNIATENKYIIAPLAENFFNKCKSDLKYLECCAVGRVCICTDFEGSPYHWAHPLQKVPLRVTAKQLDYIIKQCDEHYDEIIEYQYDYLNKRWLENNLDKYKQIFEPKKVSI